TPPGQPQPPAVLLPHGGEGLCVRRMTVWWTCRRPFMGRPVPRELLRNAVLDVTTIVPTTAYHRRSYTERYSRFRGMGDKPHCVPLSHALGARPQRVPRAPRATRPGPAWAARAGGRGPVCRPARRDRPRQTAAPTCRQTGG